MNKRRRHHEPSEQLANRDLKQQTVYRFTAGPGPGPASAGKRSERRAVRECRVSSLVLGTKARGWSRSVYCGQTKKLRGGSCDVSVTTGPKSCRITVDRVPVHRRRRGRPSSRRSPGDRRGTDALPPPRPVVVTIGCAVRSPKSAAYVRMTVSCSASLYPPRRRDGVRTVGVRVIIAGSDGDRYFSKYQLPSDRGTSVGNAKGRRP